MNKNTEVLASNIAPASSQKNHPGDAQVVIRSNDQLSKLVQFDAEGRATLIKDSKITALEIGQLGAEFANQAASATVRAVNTLNLALMLPAVPTPKADGKGTYDRNAFDVACEFAAKECKSQSAWQNVKGMFLAVEVTKQLEGKGVKVNPFKVKNALGYLNALEMIDDKGALKPGKDSDAGVKLLLDPTVGNTALVEKLNEVKKAKNAEAKATGAVIPFPKLEERIRGTTTAHAPAVLTTDTPELIDREILGIIGRWDKLVSGAKPEDTSKVRDALRKACDASMKALAKLAGLNVK